MEKQDRLRDFERVVLPHLDAAHNLARWLVRDRSTAEDVVQDAMVRACKYFASFRGTNAKAWLLQIVRNAAYSCIKAQRGAEVSLNGETRAHEDGVDVELPDPRPGPEATVQHREDLAALDQALNALPAVLRECLVLREVELLPYKHIARITGVPIGTVMSRLSRARQALAETHLPMTSRISPQSRLATQRKVMPYYTGSAGTRPPSSPKVIRASEPYMLQ